MNFLVYIVMAPLSNWFVQILIEFSDQAAEIGFLGDGGVPPAPSH
jgi:hypothetical protein